MRKHNYKKYSAAIAILIGLFYGLMTPLTARAEIFPKQNSVMTEAFEQQNSKYAYGKFSILYNESALQTDKIIKVLTWNTGYNSQLFYSKGKTIQFFIQQEFVVTNTNDSGAGSLRQAIFDANANPGADIIKFNIPGAAPQTIQPLSELPAITDPVTIDGYSQPGANRNTLPVGSDAVMGINLDGTLIPLQNLGPYFTENATPLTAGLHISAGSSKVRGFAIGNFQGHGIILTGSGANVIEGNFLGTDATGSTARGNGLTGVFANTPDNLVGTNGDGSDDFAERNVISGNSKADVMFSNNQAARNIAAGNYIGLDKSGTFPIRHTAADRVDDPSTPFNETLDNRQGMYTCTNGVWISGPNTRIGTDGNGVADIAERNVISGLGRTSQVTNLACIHSQSNGVLSYGTGAANTVVAGNYIGTDATGSYVVKDPSEVDFGQGSGIRFAFSSNNGRVGTDSNGMGDTEERNVISGNVIGIVIITSDSTVIAGNYIGTKATGMSALPNRNGVYNDHSTTNRIGGTNTTDRNIISGNKAYGIQLFGNLVNATSILNNYIGLAVDGTSPLGNQAHGLGIEGATDTVVGGSNPNARNLISSNAGYGIYVYGSANATGGHITNSRIQGNYVGTDVTGTLKRGNGYDGIHVPECEWRTHRRLESRRA